MRTNLSSILTRGVVLALFAAGCGKTCPTEPPQVNQIANCFAPAGSSVSYALRLCPTCNQTVAGCSVDMSGADANGGTIFLDPTVEACESSSSCGPSCLENSATCTFTVPSGAAINTTFTVEVYDSLTNRTKTGTLTVADTSSCVFPPS